MNAQNEPFKGMAFPHNPSNLKLDWSEFRNAEYVYSIDDDGNLGWGFRAKMVDSQAMRDTALDCLRIGYPEQYLNRNSQDIEEGQYDYTAEICVRNKDHHSRYVGITVSDHKTGDPVAVIEFSDNGTKLVYNSLRENAQAEMHVNLERTLNDSFNSVNAFFQVPFEQLINDATTYIQKALKVEPNNDGKEWAKPGYGIVSSQVKESLMQGGFDHLCRYMLEEAKYYSGGSINPNDIAASLAVAKELCRDPERRDAYIYSSDLESGVPNVRNGISQVIDEDGKKHWTSVDYDEYGFDLENFLFDMRLNRNSYEDGRIIKIIENTVGYAQSHLPKAKDVLVVFMRDILGFNEADIAPYCNDSILSDKTKAMKDEKWNGDLKFALNERDKVREHNRNLAKYYRDRANLRESHNIQVCGELKERFPIFEDRIVKAFELKERGIYDKVKSFFMSPVAIANMGMLITYTNNYISDALKQRGATVDLKTPATRPWSVAEYTDGLRKKIIHSVGDRLKTGNFELVGDIGLGVGKTGYSSRPDENRLSADTDIDFDEIAKEVITPEEIDKLFDMLDGRMDWITEETSGQNPGDDER